MISTMHCLGKMDQIFGSAGIPNFSPILIIAVNKSIAALTAMQSLRNLHSTLLPHIQRIAARADELKAEHLTMRNSYYGLPLAEDQLFDVELIGRNNCRA